MKKTETSTRDRKETPPEFETPKDPREQGGEYPNYWVRKTRSGHVIMLDDSKDNEHMTFQHRSGSMLQFLPDGGIQSVANKGRYDTTFGENRVKITGSHDVKVDGSASYKTEGQFNQTVYGDSTVSVKGDSINTSKTQNTLVANQYDVAAGSMTFASQSGTTITSKGAMSITGKGTSAIGSTEGATVVGAYTNAVLTSKDGTKVETKNGPVEVTNNQAQIKFEGQYVYINSGRGAIQPASQPTQPSQEEPPSNPSSTQMA
jgi:hypothetical protein